jgi:nicotinic acid phosphoribosyltransferase
MGYVYLLESSNDDGTIYKIGYTKNDVKKRIEKLQTGNPYEIKEVYTYRTKYKQKLERCLHNRFSHCRLKGEWFSLELDDVVSFINTCKLIEKNLDILKDNYFFNKENRDLNIF